MNPEELSKKSPLELDESKVENTPPTPEKKYSSTTLKPLRTYQGDVESIIGSQKTSAVTIAVAEQKRREEKRVINPEPIEHPVTSFFVELKNKSFLILSILLLCSAIGGVIFVFYMQTAPVVIPQKNTLITASKEISIPTDNRAGTDIVNEIIQQKNSLDGHLNSITHVNFTTAGTDADVQTLVALIAPRIPPSLVRSLDAKYMFGFFSSDKNYPFILLTTNDYGSSWSGMLAWESGMNKDFGQLFNIQNDGHSSIFTDETIQNKDLRIIQDINKKTVLLYSFIDKNTILITSNETVFSSILGKFIEGKIVR